MTLRLLYGDKRYPTRVLDLNDENIAFRAEGFNPGPGKLNVVYSSQVNWRDGQRRIISSRGNAEFTLTYRITGSSAASAGQLQRMLLQFALDAQAYEEDAQGEPVWLEYRFKDGLEDLPAPVWGQFSHYVRVLTIEVTEWPQTISTPLIGRGAVLGVVAKFTTAPFAEGLEQQFGKATGFIKERSDGVVVAQGGSPYNYFTNPSFGHNTWNTGWTASNAALSATQELKKTRSYGSAVRLQNTSASTAYNYTQALATLPAAPYICGFYARRTDGGAVTSSDVQLIVNSNTTYTPPDGIIDLGDGWYFVFEEHYVASTPGNNFGVRVQPMRNVIVDDFILLPVDTFGQFTRFLFANGDTLGGSWASTRHNSTSSVSAGDIAYVLGAEMAGVFTLNFWGARVANHTQGEYTLIKYRISATDYLELYYWTNPQSYTLVRYNGSSSSATAYLTGDPIGFSMLSLTHDGGTFRLYINGVLQITLAGESPLLPNGTLHIGSDYDLAHSSADFVFDGVRIWDKALSGAELQQLYSNEHPIKQRGEAVGMPPYLWTYDTSTTGNVFENEYNISGADFPNGVLGGISGDAEAALKFEIYAPTGGADLVFSRVYLARKALEITDYVYVPSLMWLEFSGVGTYVTTSTDATQSTGISDPNGVRQLRGRALVLSRNNKSSNTGSTGTVTLSAKYYFENGFTEMQADAVTVTLPTAAAGPLFELGELNFDWRQGASDSVIIGVDLSDMSGETVGTDFLALMPAPYCKISGDHTGIAGDVALHVEGTKARIMDLTTSFGAYDYGRPWEHTGHIITAVPGKYNHIFMLTDVPGSNFDRSLINNIQRVWITPQFLLPGGPLA